MNIQYKNQSVIPIKISIFFLNLWYDINSVGKRHHAIFDCRFLHESAAVLCFTTKGDN